MLSNCLNRGRKLKWKTLSVVLVPSLITVVTTEGELKLVLIYVYKNVYMSVNMQRYKVVETFYLLIL